MTICPGCMARQQFIPLATLWIRDARYPATHPRETCHASHQTAYQWLIPTGDTTSQYRAFDDISIGKIVFGDLSHARSLSTDRSNLVHVSIPSVYKMLPT
ncbi:hypothetical protein QCA50_014341 [Cerrena zonata]|uniref:Uncharacterized protein n=1 Tax=Cerrena zonata TaxID=2478898 RepID=A0AAW0FNY2_9APHY